MQTGMGDSFGCPLYHLNPPAYTSITLVQITMNLGELLNKMLVLATNSHSGQYDKSGKPYILHPLKVMHYLKTDDEELQCIALGHDLVEDTDVTYSQLRQEGFTDRVIEGIRALTKERGETYDEYKEKVLANPDAVLVKMADLRHNTDIRRLKGASEKDIARTQKYYLFYLQLLAHVGNEADA